MTTTPNPADLGELVARLTSTLVHFEQQNWDLEGVALTVQLTTDEAKALLSALTRLPALAAQQREIERLTPSDPWHWKNRATKAEAEVAALQKALRDAITRKEWACNSLDQAARWFEGYAEHHQAKGANDKAATNRERAKFLRGAADLSRIDHFPELTQEGGNV